MAPPPKVRRRPALWAIGAALIVLGGLGAAWVATSVSDTQKVLVLAKDVDRGSRITAADLTTAQVNVDPSLRFVQASSSDSIAGHYYATRDLNAGTMLTEQSIATKPTVPQGKSVVGVALKAGQLPGVKPRPGDTVTVVSTPANGGGPNPGLNQAQPVKGIVQDVSYDSASSLWTVDVVVDISDAAKAQDIAATGNVGLILGDVSESDSGNQNDQNSNAGNQ